MLAFEDVIVTGHRSIWLDGIFYDNPLATLNGFVGLKSCLRCVCLILLGCLDDYVACYRVGDAVGCAAVYAPEAELYSPYGPAAIGRAAIKAAHQDWVAEGAEDKQIKVINADCSGDLGWCLAHYSEGATGMGTSMNILARQSNGDWLITHCSLNEA